MKEQLHKHNSEVNIDEIWAAIEPQVDAINAEKKKKKRYLPFFFLGALLLVGGMTLFVLNTNEQNETAPIKLQKNIVNSSQSSLKQAHNTEELEGVNTQTVKENTANIEEEESVKRTTMSKPVASSSTTKVTREQNSSKAVAASVVQNEKTTAIKSSIEENVSVVASAKTTNEEQNTNSLKTNQHAQIVEVEETSFETLDLLPANTPNLLVTQELALDFPEVSKPVDAFDGAALPSSSPFTLDLGINYGIGFINRDLAEKKDTFASELLRLRRESETLLEQQHYGFSAKLTHESGFSLTSGIQHTLLTERYDNLQQIIEMDTMYGVEKRVVGLDGDTTDIFGFIDVTHTYDYEKEVYNRYRMWDIPVLLGYEGGRNNWTIGVQAGAIFNLAMQTSGQIRNTNTNDLNIDNDQSDIFKSSVGLSIYGGLRVAHTFHNGMTVHLAPHMRFFTKDFATKNYPLQQKYSTFGVQVGVGYLIGK